MPDTPTPISLPEALTIRFEGKLPGEELAVAIIQLQIKRLEYMSPELRAAYLQRFDDFEAFWNNLFAPLRNLAFRLHEVGK